MESDPPDAALGADEDEVVVRIGITDGLIRSLEYATSGEPVFEVATTISEVGAVEPIVGP